MTETLYDRVTGRTVEVVIHPPEVQPALVPVTVNLRKDQRRRLAALKSEISRTGGVTMPAAAVIRGVLDAVAAADLNLGQCRTEADIKAAVLARLTRR